LLAEALGCQRIELYTTFDDVPSDDRRAAFRELVRRRAEGTPVAYLVGRREFYSMSFRVTSDVLIPRPETELLVVAVLDLAKKGPEARGQGSERGEGRGESAEEHSQSPNLQISKSPNPSPQSLIPNPSIADVGTGSGVIAICLAKHLPASRVVATDISRAALDVARENARKHGVADRIEFLEGDLLGSLPGGPRFDFVVSNPPYVTAAEFDGLAADVRKFEPHTALVAGPKGTELIERLIPQAAERLLPGGHLLMEIGPAIHEAVLQLLGADRRFEVGPTIKDLAKLPRVVQAKRT
jgi:release factor glutamine methyltransferase